MKLVVDLTRCQGYAQCAFLAPDAFTMVGDGEALLYDPDPDEEMRERVLRAAAACPVQAIVLDRGPASQEDRAAVAAAQNGHGHHDEAFLRTGRIVIVGASLAGARAAGALRYEGFIGSLTVIGDEAHDPYDRPPLSKQVLEGSVGAWHTGLPRRQAIDADWRLGSPPRAWTSPASGYGSPTGRTSPSTGCWSPPAYGPGRGRTRRRRRSRACSCCVRARMRRR